MAFEAIEGRSGNSLNINLAMVLLQIIGTIGAIIFLLLTRKRSKGRKEIQFITSLTAEAESNAQLAVVRETYLREKEAWLVEHTDPLFGRPNDSANVHYFEMARSSWDARNVLNDYRVPFKFSRDGFVAVIPDEFPLLDQKFIFEWMVEHMDEIVATLRHDSEICTDGLSRQAAQSFNPEQILEITFKGSEPVVLGIRFEADVDYGESVDGMIEGKDQNVKSVSVLA
jgi:hypothetical protein